MTDPTKETVWITIPDESAPILEASSKVIEKDLNYKIKNRAFWGIAFVALAAFLALLFAPQQIIGMMQAQLFDGTFKVVPDFEKQQSGTLFGEGTGESVAAEAADTQKSADNTVVEAQSEAVSIQVEPVTDTTEAIPSEDTGVTAEPTVAVTEEPAATEAVTEPENIVVDTETVSGTKAGETLDANAQLLQSLSKQLEDFKEKQRRSDQQIQDLMQLLEDQAAGVHGAAAAQPGAVFVPGGQVGLVGTQSQIGIGAETGAGMSVYRYNTHTVTVSPYDVMAQNKSVQTQQGAYQANVAYGNVQTYSNQAYNPILAGVQGQPDTGPAETTLFALLLASFGVLVWGSVRAIRA